MKINWFPKKDTNQLVNILSDVIILASEFKVDFLQTYLILGENICKDCNRNFKRCVCNDYDFSNNSYTYISNLGINLSKHILNIKLYNIIIAQIKNTHMLSEEFKPKLLKRMKL